MPGRGFSFQLTGSELVVADQVELATQWVGEGRIAPAEHDHYRGLLDIDEDKTIALASKLAPGRIPVDTQRGTATHTEITSTGWFPQLEKKES